MPLHRTRSWRSAWPLAALLACTASCAETVPEDTIKAGFILNFAKFTEWPASAPNPKELVVCGIGTETLSGKLPSLQGRQAQGREVKVRQPSRPSEWGDCHVLFVAAEELPRYDAALRSLRLLPVLTVSDAVAFAEAGGIIGLKLRGGRVRFDINLRAAREAGLKLSSQVLKLADEVLQ